MLLEVVGHPMERPGFAAHSLDAKQWDIEGAVPADSWAGDTHLFCNHLYEHCNPYRAVSGAC